MKWHLHSAEEGENPKTLEVIPGTSLTSNRSLGGVKFHLLKAKVIAKAIAPLVVKAIDTAIIITKVKAIVPGV